MFSLLPSQDDEGTSPSHGVCVPYPDVSVQAGADYLSLTHTETLDVLSRETRQSCEESRYSSLCLSVYLSIHPLVSHSVSQLVCQSVCLSVSLFACLSVYLYPSVSQSVCLLSVCLSVIYPSISQSVCLSVCPPTLPLPPPECVP